jgi:hypothetical protein
MFKELIRKLNIEKKTAPFVLSIVFTLLLFSYLFFSHYLLGTLQTLAIILWSFMLLVIMFFAGFMVTKSFIKIGAGISLIIFLAQSYCKVPHISSTDDALKTLIIIGFFTITYDFLFSLYESSLKLLEIINKNDKRWPIEKLIIIGLFILFALLFVCIIYQVIKPIILDLCIYK